MSSDSLQYAASLEQEDVFSTDEWKNLFHEIDVDQAIKDFENDVDRAMEDHKQAVEQANKYKKAFDEANKYNKNDVDRAHVYFEYKSSGSESENSDLAELPSSHNAFGTSVLSAGFFTPSSAQTRNVSRALHSTRSVTSSLGIGRSFATARSSLASYATASNSSGKRLLGLTLPTEEVSLGKMTTLRVSPSVTARQELGDLVDAIEKRLLRRTDAVLLLGRLQEDTHLMKGYILVELNGFLGLGVRVTSLDPCIQGITAALESWNDDEYDIAFSNIRLDISVEIYMYALKTHHLKHLVPNGIFTDGQMSNSEWILHLHSRGILPDEAHALDWSGRGQHTEYLPGEESLIPLAEGKVLGHSVSAIIQNVQCRRIQLARKTIRCNKKLTKEMAITEVEHLQRAQHRHVVRLVGTYTFKRSLAILLYPAAKWNLDEFLDELSDQFPLPVQFDLALRTFFGCLTNGMLFIHELSIKHMDIKPKNILVHVVQGLHQVFIADFGIARAYASAEESNTDSPTSFTPIYAAPEVATQGSRDLSADIFSLGCVFLEILAVLSSSETLNLRVCLIELRKGGSYQAHLEAVLKWYDQHMGAFEDVFRDKWGRRPDRMTSEQVLPFRNMLAVNRHKRPYVHRLWSFFRHFSCGSCEDGPEPFVAADK
jgi:serine/threonine protein kinase